MSRAVVSLLVLGAAFLLLSAGSPPPDANPAPGPKAEQVPGEARVDLLNRLAFASWSKDPRHGVELGQQALALARQLNYGKGIARALNCIGLNWWLQGDNPRALSHYQQALETSRAIGDRKAEANTLNNLGKLYGDLGSSDLALENYFLTLRIHEQAQDAFGVARVLNNIGEIYVELKRYDEALTFFQRSLAMKKQDGRDREGQATTCLNIGTVYRMRRDFPRAVAQFRESLQLSAEIGKKSGMADAHFSIGEALLTEGKARRALASLERALQIRRELGDRKGIAGCLNQMGAARLRLGDYAAAQALLGEARAMAAEIGAKQELINSWANLSELYAARLEYARALQAFQTHARLKDELYTAEASQKIANLSILYENQQKESEIELGRVKLDKQKQLGRLLLVIIALALLTIFFIYSRFRIKERVNHELAWMNDRLEMLSRTDSLTQLANRRDFIDKVNYEVARYLRSRKIFSIIMGDIDDFKKINDRHGHNCGDYVLVTVARLIREAVREQDLVARWGGEEFILMLPETDLDGSRILSERIGRKIEGYAFSYEGVPLQVTMTFGVAAFIEGRRIDDCIAMADQALYRGKTAGKNRVVLQEA